MQPILFRLYQNPAQGIRSARQLGRPRLLRGGIPLPVTYYLIFGVTKDGTGAPLGNCSIDLFRTEDDVRVDSMVSDGSGNYIFSVSRPTQYYIVAYKVGSPDVAGTTVNTLMGV